MIQITLNGENLITASQSLSCAMIDWGYTAGSCAVALNGEFIAHTDYATTQLTDGDCLHIVVPMQGG